MRNSIPDTLEKPLVLLLAVLASAAFSSSALAGTVRWPAMVGHQLVGHAVNGQRALAVVSPQAATASVPVAPVASDPIAHATSVNGVIPVFGVSFGYRVVPGRVQLTQLILSPFYKRYELAPAGGCTLCAGKGHFERVGISGHEYTDKVHGQLFMTRRTRFVQAVGAINRIGRFKVYGLNPNPAAAPVALLTGCTPANLAINGGKALHFRKLPTVACSAPKPHGDHVTISAPTEFSTTRTEPGEISGYSTPKQWLIAFQSDRSLPCSFDALAEQHRTHTYFQRQVKGRFAIRYTTAPSPTPGVTCAYLQSGGRVRVGTGRGLPFPDGRVTATASRAYVSGDRIGITSPPSAVPDQTMPITLAGTASVKEQAYFFAPSVPCASSAQAEFTLDPSDFSATEDPGSFSNAVAIMVSASAPPTVYECAYLQLGTPTSSRVPVGPTLATGTGTIAITGSTTPQPAVHAAHGRAPDSLSIR